MIAYIFVFLLLYIISNHIFRRLRIILNFMTMVLGLLFFLNDWNNSVIADDTLKLSFLLSFLLYGYIVWYNIYIED